MLSVVDVNWHMFGEINSDSSEECMACGGRWEYTDKVDPEFPESTERTYHASNGDAPSRCVGISQYHGEAPCEANNGRECEVNADKGTCEHMADDTCNCVFCG